MRGRTVNQEIVQFFAGSKLNLQPAGLLTTTGPGFRRVLRVLVFGQHRGIGAARAFLVLGRSGRPLDLAKPLFELGLFRGSSCDQAPAPSARYEWNSLCL